MVSFVHTSDTHFGVENYGKTDAKTGLHTRLIDFKNSFNYVIDFSIDRNVDFFLFCGDAYKTAYPTPTQQKLFLKSLMRLYNANIPVVIIVGNHDHPLSFGKASSLDVFDSLPMNGFHVFSKPDILKLNTNNGLIQIVGIPWPTRNNLITNEQHKSKNAKEVTEYLSSSVGQIIQNFAQKLDPKIPAVLAAHLTVSTGVFSGSEKCAVFGNDPIFLPSQLAIEPFNYVALGHLHRHQNLNPRGQVPIIYPGSIERIDFGERKEEKGFCFVTINSSNDRKVEHEFIELKTRKMVQIDVKLDAAKDQTKQILDKINEIDLCEAIVKIVYHLPSDKSDKVDLYEVLRACAKALRVVSVTPVRSVELRERRVELKVDMNLKTMLEKYLDEKKDLKLDKDKIIQKALELRDEVNSL